MLEDNTHDVELIKHILAESLADEFILEWVRDGESFKQALIAFKPDLVLSDYNLPQYNGFEALAYTLAFDEYLPFIIVTGTLVEEVAADSIKRGAWDYVVKERITRLVSSIEKTM